MTSQVMSGLTIGAKRKQIGHIFIRLHLKKLYAFSPETLHSYLVRFGDDQLINSSVGKIPRLTLIALNLSLSQKIKKKIMLEYFRQFF